MGGEGRDGRYDLAPPPEGGSRAVGFRRACTEGTGYRQGGGL